MMTNIMATLPKKCGSARIVAIAATLYRLMMQMIDGKVAENEKANAYHGDSAIAGASAVNTDEDGALHVELETFEGQLTIAMLWDLKNFFGSIDITKLVQERS